VLFRLSEDLQTLSWEKKGLQGLGKDMAMGFGKMMGGGFAKSADTARRVDLSTLVEVLQGPESNVIRRNRGEKPISSADAGGGTVEGDYSSYKEAKENLCLSLLFVSNEKDADRDSLDIQCESDEAFISWVVGFQALMALHEALSGGAEGLASVRVEREAARARALARSAPQLYQAMLEREEKQMQQMMREAEEEANRQYEASRARAEAADRQAFEARVRREAEDQANALLEAARKEAELAPLAGVFEGQRY
jgi:hypothetical protein